MHLTPNVTLSSVDASVHANVPPAKYRGGVVGNMARTASAAVALTVRRPYSVTPNGVRIDEQTTVPTRANHLVLEHQRLVLTRGLEIG